MKARGINLGIVGLCVGLLGTGLLTVLLLRHDINQIAFTLMLPLMFVAAYGIYRGDSVSEINLKELKVTLQRVEQIKTDVYAKADEVQTLIEQLARFMARRVAQANRFGGGEDATQTMLSERDEIISMLHQIKTLPTRMAEIVRPINVMADLDMRSYLWRDLRNDIIGKIPNDHLEDFRIHLIEQYNRTELVRALRSADIDVAPYDDRLHALDAFRRGNQLS